MSLDGKVALITGASRGIGKAIALRLAKEGVHIAVASKTVEPHPKLPGTIHETADAVRQLGVKAAAIRMDVRDTSEIESGVEQTVSELGRLDIAIHNAGALWWKPILDTPPKKFDLVHEVNARGAFGLAHFAIPHMIKSGGGHFLVMSPPIDLRAVTGKTAYVMSKFGMTMVALGVAEEHRKDNVAGNALWPDTAIESAATQNFGLGTPSEWYKADIVADATYEMVRRAPSERTGQAMLVLDVLREAGITDFIPYRCDPNSEPPILTVSDLPRAGGKELAGGAIRGQSHS